MLFLPETPRWLAGHGHVEQARAALLSLRGPGVDLGPEMARLRADLKIKAKALPSSHLGHEAARLPLIVGIGLAIFQQVTGVNTVIYFAPVIFQAAGLSSASAAILATAGIGIVNVGMTVVAIWLVDKVGRRPLLLGGLLGMGLSLCLLATAFLLGKGGALGALTAGSLAIYVGCFAIGLGPVFWLLVAEIFPLAIRARGISAATIANWVANLFVALTFLNLTELLGRPGVFFLFAALTFGALVFAYMLVPETKGLSLEAVEALWIKRAGGDPLGRRLAVVDDHSS